MQGPQVSAWSPWATANSIFIIFWWAIIWIEKQHSLWIWFRELNEPFFFFFFHLWADFLLVTNSGSWFRPVSIIALKHFLGSLNAPCNCDLDSRSPPPEGNIVCPLLQEEGGAFLPCIIPIPCPAGGSLNARTPTIAQVGSKEGTRWSTPRGHPISHGCPELPGAVRDRSNALGTGRHHPV